VMPIEHASKYPYSPSGVVPGGSLVAIPDPFVWLAFAAAVTSRITLATGVVVLPQQHALVIAKQVATLDRLSGGRAVLGVGAGWLLEEFEALGATFDDRGSRMDEQINVLRASWRDPVVTHHGPSMSIDRVAVEPKPVQASVPIVIGGHTPAAARRSGRIGDGFFPLSTRGDTLVQLARTAREAAERAGRDPDALEITADAPRSIDQVEALRAAGVVRVVINAPHVATSAMRDALAEQIAGIQAMFGEG
jgi:probable F420-dependent oxidoreductase